MGQLHDPAVLNSEKMLNRPHMLSVDFGEGGKNNQIFSTTAN